VASSCPSIAVLAGDIQLASTLPGWNETKIWNYFFPIHVFLAVNFCSPNWNCVLKVASSCPALLC
jgi:hypothetical protein